MKLLDAAEAIAVGRVERVVKAVTLAYDIPPAVARDMRGLARAAVLFAESREYGEAERCHHRLAQIEDEGEGWGQLIRKATDAARPVLNRSAGEVKPR